MYTTAYTARVHGRTHVYGRYTAVHVPCMGHVHGCVHVPCTRSSTHVHGPYTAEDTAREDSRVHGPYMAVYMSVYTGRVTAVYGPSTRSVYIHGRVHEPWPVYTAVYGRVRAMYGSCTRPCTRAVYVHGRVHDRLHVYTAGGRPGTRPV